LVKSSDPTRIIAKLNARIIARIAKFQPEAGDRRSEDRDPGARFPV